MVVGSWLAPRPYQQPITSSSSSHEEQSLHLVKGLPSFLPWNSTSICGSNDGVTDRRRHASGLLGLRLVVFFLLIDMSVSRFPANMQ